MQFRTLRAYPHTFYPIARFEARKYQIRTHIAVSFSYDKDGNQLTHRRRSGAVISATYDVYGRILSKSTTGSDSFTQTYTYNASGMVLGTTKTVGGVSDAVNFNYDGLARAVQHVSTVTPANYGDRYRNYCSITVITVIVTVIP